MPKERDPFRKYVEYVEKNKWKCNFCGLEARGSTPRIRAHLAGIPGYGIKTCEKVNHLVRGEALETFNRKGSVFNIRMGGTSGEGTEGTAFGASQSVLPSDDASNPNDTQNSNQLGCVPQQPSFYRPTGTGTAPARPQDNLDNTQQSDPSNRRLDVAHGNENASSIQQFPMDSSASSCLGFSELQTLLQLPTHLESETEQQNARGLSSSPNDEVHCSSMSVGEHLSLGEHIADGITPDSLLHPTYWSNLDHSLPENLPESREAIVNTFEEIQTNELHNPTVGSSLQIVSSLDVDGANRLLDCGQPCIDEVVPVRSNTSSTNTVQHPGQLPITSDKENENDIRQFPSRTPLVIDPSTALQHSSDSHIFEATIVHSLVPEASTNPIGPPSSHASVPPQRQSVPHQSTNLETAHQNPTVPSSSWKNHLVTCHPQALTDMDACMPSSQAPNNASPPPRILPRGTGLIGPSSILELHMNESAPVTSHPNTDNFEENRALKRKPMENMEEKRQVATIGKYVGTDDQVGHIMGLMNIDAKDKRMVVVIHGEAGIGKTTLAKLIYNQMSWGFDGCSFIADITETAQELGGLQLLQTKLISDVLKRELEDVSFISGGIEFLRDLFCNMRVLIVLDDVENAFHVEKLIGDGFDCFASGSRILVTTRNNAVLEESPQIWAYHVSRLNKDQALQLLRQHASLPTSLEILNNALNAMAGLPLFIEVMGAVLNGTPQERWSQLLIEPMFRQQNVRLFLEKVFQTLDYKQKQIFLDIACFTTSIYSRIAWYLWYDTSFLPSEILTPLAKIGENNQIWMHSLLRQFGREIVSMENLTDPGRRSRLFDHEIAFDTIKRKKGTEKVEALCLNFHGHTSDKLRPEDFKSMPNLRFLQLDDADIAGDFTNLFPNLRWLRWRGCPRHLQPFNFQLGNLTILDLSWSKVTKDWEGWDQIEMKNLRVLDLTGCADLLVTPKFSGYKNLAILILERCTQLVKIDHSIDDLQHLVTLNLKFCTELSMLPVEVGHLTALKELYMDGTSIQEIPISIGHLKQLETLTASNCFSLTQLPRTICHLTNISLLSLDGTKIIALPDSIGELIRLKHLSLRDCRRLRKLPNSIGNIGRSLVELDVSGTGVSKFPDSLKNLQNLKVLRMDSCFFRKFPPGIGKLTSLEEIHASWCRSLEGEIPSEIKKLHNLRILILRHSSISSIPMEIYRLSNLHTLDLLHCNMIKELPRLPSSIKVFYVDDELKSSHLLDSPLHSTDWSNLHLSLPENLLESRVVLVNTSEEIETNELHNPTVGSSLQIDSSFDVDGANRLWDCGQPREMEMVPLRSSTSLTDTGQHPSQLPPRFDKKDGNETCQFLSRTPTDVDPSIASQHTSDSHISEATIIDSPVPKASTNTTGASSSHVTGSPMAIGEIFWGSFFQVLLDKLASMGLEYAQQEGINTTLLQCKVMLETINAVLDDAEEKQLNGDRLVKLWLDDVRDLAYDLEDLLDEFEIETTQAKLEAESSTSRGRVKRKFSFFSRPRSLVSKTMLREIKSRFEDIVNRKAHLSLREKVVDRSHCTNKRLPSTSLLEPQFFGREKEEVEILKLLINEAKNADSALSIVPIVGMGGIGKTAMAQRLYNDPKINSYFERKAWVCVSDVFDVLDITKTILQSITGLSCEGKDLNWLQVKLKDDLSEKKFLVVLDDVWNEKYGEWTSLLKPFEVGAKGSKIIITTRNHPVVSITGASPYPLKELSVDNCTSLLAYHALEARNFERHPHLEIVGKKIAEKCRGLPLAAKILGGLLRNKENPDEWEAILNNRIWDVASAKNNEVLPALKLSYVHLPSYLKRCFAYCAVFPKDYEFERDELALLWIAEGFLGEEKEKEKGGILRLGRDCFDELVSRSFFQQSSVNTSKFLMHDLLNDLAKSIANTTCFTFGDSKVVSTEEKVRYASFVSQMVTTESSRAYARMKVLRSLMLLNVQSTQNREGIFISGKVLHDLLTNSKYLRVLSLCHCDIIEVPNCVCDLKHLRYLNLSYTNIKRLPESIGALCKLQALILRGCRMLSMLPPNIANLVSLQFLDIRGTEGLKEMPLNIGNLRNLIVLPKFVVGVEKGPRLKELKNLPHLQGDLLISELQKVEEVRDAIDANLFGKQDLSNLFLHWNEGSGDSQNIERAAQVLHSLRPHTNIKNLTISYYGGGIFPSWLNGPSYSKMVSLCLLGCHNVRLLPSLGQLPSLRELSLKDLRAIRMIGSEFYGTESPFPSLTILKFEGMLAWKEWSYYAGGREERVPFPCLQHLVVRRCQELTGELPRQLDNLIKLEICSCLHLNDSTNVICLPSLCELHVKDCNKEILKWFGNLTSLTILKIENLVEIVYFDNGFMSYLVKLKELHIRSCGMLTYLWQDRDGTRNLTCLQSVVIESCPQFTSFMRGQGEIELPCDLERMELRGCTSLERLPSKLHTLRRLIIWSCPKIMGLTISPNDPSNNNTMSQLEYLSINRCDSWVYFPFAKDRLAALKTLTIKYCKGVESIAEIIVVESLESLNISYCVNLGSLPQCLHMLIHLTHLEISGCPALEDLPPLPLTLLSLSLSGCPKMKSIANSNIDSCNNLTFLEISHCRALEMEDFPPLPITLLHIRLYFCPKIKSLEWHRLTSLQWLEIRHCENIECFPEGGLPPNLREFEIWGCKNMKQPVREWGLPMLTSLERVGMDGSSMGGEGDKECFPSDEDNGDSWSLLFPSSLKFVSIDDMRNVERLSNGLRNHLSSLQDLWIGNCPKLRDLPEDGFPPSFQWLSISGCEILKHRCSKHTGDYWPLVQEIPFFKIDEVRIH